MIPLIIGLCLAHVTFCNNLSGSDAIRVAGYIGGISDGFVYISDIQTGDTLGTSTIKDHLFHIDNKWPDISKKSIPTILKAIQNDREISMSCPLILEPVSITIQWPEDGIPKYAGSPDQDKFSFFAEETGDLNAQLFDRFTGEIVDSIQNELTARFERFYLENKGGILDPFLSLWIADNIERRLVDPSEFTTIPAICDSNTALTVYQQSICEAIKNYEKSWIGQKPTEIIARDNFGNSVDLSDLIGKKIIVIDFWASWCGPCLQEMPLLKSIYNASRIEIIGISIDRRRVDWLAALNRQQLPWINIHDEKGVIAKAYNVTAVPTKIVIDRSGLIVSRNPEDLQALLRVLEE